MSVDNSDEVLYDPDNSMIYWDETARLIEQGDLKLVFEIVHGAWKAYLVGICPRCGHSIGSPTHGVPLRKVLGDEDMFETQVRCDCPGYHGSDDRGCGFSYLYVGKISELNKQAAKGRS